MTQTIEEIRTEALAVAQAMVDDIQAVFTQHTPHVEAMMKKIIDSDIPDAIKAAITDEMSKLVDGLQT